MLGFIFLVVFLSLLPVKAQSQIVVGAGGPSVTISASPMPLPISEISGGTGQSVYAVGDLLAANTTTSLSRLPSVASGSLFASAGVGTLPGYTTDPVITGSLTSNRALTGTSVLGGIVVSASTGAALGAQQDAPWIRIIGNGWNNTANASHPAEFGFRLRPGQGNPVTATLTLFQQINTGGYSTIGTWTNAGLYTSAAGLTATTTVSAGSTVNAVTNYLSNASIFYNGSAATLTSGFSTTTPTVTGKASSFSVLIAATPGVTGTVTFATAFTNVPNCSCTNTITANAVQAVPTVSTCVINGVWIAGDTLRCVCLGY